MRFPSKTTICALTPLPCKESYRCRSGALVTVLFCKYGTCSGLPVSPCAAITAEPAAKLSVRARSKEKEE